MKFQMINIDSSKSGALSCYEDILIVNLNSLIRRVALDRSYLINYFKPVIDYYPYVNLCNLASLCNKLNISYNSDECYNLVHKVVNVLKELRPDITFIQSGVYNDGELDMLPFTNLFNIDNNAGFISVNKILKDKFRLLGYVDSQIIYLLSNIKDITKLIPADLLNDVPFINDYNMIAYSRFKELLS